MGFSIALTQTPQARTAHFGVLSGSIQTLGKIRLLIWALPAAKAEPAETRTAPARCPLKPPALGPFLCSSAR
jgi:hypothetical protein